MTRVHRAHVLYAEASGDDATLIGRHAELIDRVARRLATRAGMPGLREDLWSAGALGLLDAARRFDGARGIRFETFAEHRVRGAMLDELRRMDHLPRRLRDRVQAAARARATLAQQHGRPATDDEVAAALHLDVPELLELEGTAQPLVPLDPEVLAGLDEPSPEAELERRQLARGLAARIARLPDRLQMILALHYQEDRTYREIADLLGVSEPRVCQLHRQALDLLRGDAEAEEA